jgi:hypothetical protein
MLSSAWLWPLPSHCQNLISLLLLSIMLVITTAYRDQFHRRLDPCCFLFVACFLLHAAYCLRLLPYCLLPSPVCGLLSACCMLPVLAYCMLPTYCLLGGCYQFFCLLPVASFLPNGTFLLAAILLPIAILLPAASLLPAVGFLLAAYCQLAA